MKKGFTLIELLVVVLIIGILTATALPMYEKAQKKALFTEVQTVAKTLMTAMDAYAMENGYIIGNNSLLGTDSSVGIDFPWVSCDSVSCSTKAGKWRITTYGTLYQYRIEFVPNRTHFANIHDNYYYHFVKQMHQPWTLGRMNGNLVHNSTYQMFCDWWVDGGGAATEDFISQCK